MSSTLALALGCVAEPAEIASFETGEEPSAEPSEVIDWDPCETASLIVELETGDVDVVTIGAAVHSFVIEVAPLDPPTLPTGFSASLHPVHGDAAFEVFGAGLRYEGPLQLGWSVRLHADEPASVELRAEFSAEQSDESSGDRTLCEVMRNSALGALSFTTIVALLACDASIDESGDAAACENDYSPHPFVSAPCPELWPTPEDALSHADPACAVGTCNTLELGAAEIGYAWCPIACEDVGDCAAWDPGGSVVACVDGECTWYCDATHPCPSELECGPPYDDPHWGQCWAIYAR